VRIIILFISTLCIFSCSAISDQDSLVAVISQESWGQFKGKEVKLLSIKNGNGMELKVTNYGATIVSISVPDKNGALGNVVIGFDSLQKYVNDRFMRGKTIGRYANRIGGAQFTLNGQTFKLKANNGPNSIHGGPDGFSNQVFEIDSIFSWGDSAGVAFHYLSPDMEEGFPGNLKLNLNFLLTNNNEVKIIYHATTDKPTVVNFTNHSYFNLTGNQGPVLDHIVKIAAEYVTSPGPDGLPSGELTPVIGTHFDFIAGCALKEKLKIFPVRGFDINFVLDKDINELERVAQLTDTVSGRHLDAYTTEPGMQLFTMANAVCFEMQHFPDSPNKPRFPDVVLNPGEVYNQVTIYKFSVVQP
jgi:aldose 1-epimerase